MAETTNLKAITQTMNAMIASALRKNDHSEKGIMARLRADVPTRPI